MNHDVVDNFNKIVKQSNQQDQIQSHDKVTIMNALIASKWLFVIG